MTTDFTFEFRVIFDVDLFCKRRDEYCTAFIYN